MISLKHVIFAVFLLSTSCAESMVSFQDDGLHHDKCDIFVPFANPSERIFLNDKWVVDNWTFEKLNVGTKWLRKGGRAYKGRIFVDKDGDGTMEGYTSYYSDLELRNRENPGLIWMASSELPERYNDKLLDVFLENYAEALSGAEMRVQSGIFGLAPMSSKSFAAKIMDKQPLKFGPYKAIAATIEIANLDRLKLDPKHRLGFVRIVIVRSDDFIFRKTTEVVEQKGTFVSKRKVIKEKKGIFEFGYFNSPDYFESGLDDFNFFLQQIRFNEAKAIEALPLTDKLEDKQASSVSP